MIKSLTDPVKILQTKSIFYKLVLLVFNLFLFFILLPISELDTLRSIDPLVIFTSIILFLTGGALLFEFWRNWNDAKNHNGAKSGSIPFLVMGVALLLFGGAELFGFYNIYTDAGDETALNIILVILLGGASIVIYYGTHPEIFHNKTIAKAIRTG